MKNLLKNYSLETLLKILIKIESLNENKVINNNTIYQDFLTKLKDENLVPDDTSFEKIIMIEKLKSSFQNNSSFVNQLRKNELILNKVNSIETNKTVISKYKKERYKSFDNISDYASIEILSCVSDHRIFALPLTKNISSEKMDY